MSRASRMMFWTSILVLQTSRMRLWAFILVLQITLIMLLMAGCTQQPPTDVCIASHDEQYTYQVPIQVGCAAYTNGACVVPVWAYIDESDTRSVCDKSRPITADELAEWHKAND